MGYYGVRRTLLWVNGSNSGTANPGAGSFGLPDWGASGAVIGNYCEAGVLAGDQSSHFSAITSNQRTYWGF